MQTRRSAEDPRSARQPHLRRRRRHVPFEYQPRLLPLRRAGRLRARRPRAQARCTSSSSRCRAASTSCSTTASGKQRFHLNRSYYGPLHLPDDLARARQLLVRLGLPRAGVGLLRRGGLLPRHYDFELLSAPERAAAMIAVPRPAASQRGAARGSFDGAFDRVHAKRLVHPRRRSCTRSSTSSRPTAARSTASASATASMRCT